MTVRIFSINTTAGIRYGLKFADSGNVLTNATAKWKSEYSARKFAEKMGYKIAR